MNASNQYRVSKVSNGYRLEWFEANAWNTLFSAEFSRIANVINRIKVTK